MRSILILILLTTAACAEEPTYHAQADRHLMKQPFALEGRMIEFYRHGTYRIDNISEAKEIWHGAYSLFGDVLTLDPDTSRQITCRYSFDLDDLELADCAYAGRWNSSRFK